MGPEKGAGGRGGRGGGGSNRKVRGRERVKTSAGKQSSLGDPGYNTWQGVRNKAQASGQKCSGCFRRRGVPGRPGPAGDARSAYALSALTGAAYLRQSHRRALPGSLLWDQEPITKASTQQSCGQALDRHWRLGKKSHGRHAEAGAGRWVSAWALTGSGSEPRRRWRSTSQWEEKLVSFPSVFPLHSTHSAPDLPSLPPPPSPSQWPMWALERHETSMAAASGASLRVKLVLAPELQPDPRTSMEVSPSAVRGLLPFPLRGRAHI